MKKSELKALIREVIKEELAHSPRGVTTYRGESKPTTDRTKQWTQTTVASGTEAALEIFNAAHPDSPTTLNFVTRVEPIDRKAGPSPQAKRLNKIKNDIKNREDSLIGMERQFIQFLDGFENAIDRDVKELDAVERSMVARKPNIKESTENVSVKTLRWKDGTSVGVDATGNPVGYKSLGSLNSGITLPQTNDWKKFFASPDGHSEKFLSPTLKVWYDVDSSG